MKRKQGEKQGLIAAAFLSPFLIVFFLFRFGPSIVGLLISFTEWGLVGQPHFIGLANFNKMFDDPIFFVSFKNTLYFFVLTAPMLIVLPLLLAVLLNQPTKGTKIVRTIVFLPYVTIPAVIGIIWNWLYEANFGIINYYLRIFSIPPVEWLINEKIAIISISITTIWWLTGFNMVLYLAGLQNIPVELYEAARMDGAGGFRMFSSITIPLLKPIISVVAILTTINVVQIFDQIYVMTGGGPGTSTLILVQYLYNQAFQNFNLGYSSAIGSVILLILGILAFIQFKIVKGEEV